MSTKISLVVTDLDNTLWDWYDIWTNSYEYLIQAISDRTSIPRPQLEREIREIHQRHDTLEYPYLLTDIPSLVEYTGRENPRSFFEREVAEFRRIREARTKPYPGVSRSLEKLASMGIPVVAYTESDVFWTRYRLHRTKISSHLSAVYTNSPPELPNSPRHAPLTSQKVTESELTHDLFTEVPRGCRKPDPTILRRILQEWSCQPDRAIYIGDSIQRDVLMAQRAGVQDALAAYGIVERPPNDLLTRLSNWSPEREAFGQRVDATPSLVFMQGWSEVLGLVHRPRRHNLSNNPGMQG